MKKVEEAAQTGIPEEASITNPSRPFVRLRGSHSSQQEILAAARPLRRRDDDDGDPLPDDEPPPPPPPPPPPVSTPDLALQISFCLDADMNTGIVSAVRQAIGPNADVRTACINNSQRIGIWLRPSVSNQDNQARDRGLERLNFIGTGEALAFFINSAVIRRQAFDGWNAAPKRLNGDGDPDPNGPVHLTGFSVRFEGPNKVVTRVEGFDERPWPDADFLLTITDTLSVSGGKARCDSERDLDVDTSWLNFLTGLFLIALPPLGVVFLVQRIIIATRDAPDVDAGAGCGVPALLPQEILIPAGLKVVAFYDRLEVFPGAIVAGGGFDVIARTPEVTITGPSQISVVEGTTSLTRSYTLHTEDLRPPFHEVLSPNFAARIPGPAAPRPKIAWSGDGVALSPSGETTGFRFNLGAAQAGQVITRRVAVVVVDVDGLSDSAELIVRIHVTPADVDDDFPPICRIKPWLPQCQEPLARATSSRRRERP
jgi:hypothetical protein